MSSYEAKQSEAHREEDEANREPEGPVVLNAAGGEDPEQQVRPEPTEAGEQAGERHEMRATNDDWNGEQEGEEGSHWAEDRHHGCHAAKNEGRDPEQPTIHALTLGIRRGMALNHESTGRSRRASPGREAGRDPTATRRPPRS
jgi:hypothetical protein